jgi:hypothetical protein
MRGVPVYEFVVWVWKVEGKDGVTMDEDVRNC